MSGLESFKYKTKVSQLDLGVKKEELGHIVQSLSTVQASTYILYMKTQGFHWNVVGPHFYSLHHLSEEHYQEMAEAIDTLAERIRALGHIAPSSYAQYTKFTRIEEFIENQDVKAMLEILASDHEAMSRLLKEGFDLAENAHDHATSDIFVQRINFHDKAAWMLRATLVD